MVRDEVKKLKSTGISNIEIATKLSISPSGVQYHLDPKRREYNIKKISEHRRELKIKALSFMGNKCLKCEYNKCNSALAFHHLDPNLKDLKFGSGNTHSWDKIRAELTKCILLCHNCHSELHDNLWIPDEILISKQKEINKSWIEPLKQKKVRKSKIVWPANLQELTNNSSIRAIAKLLGVSDTSIRKRLKKMDGSKN